jgi:hypothetical protein
MNGYAVAHLDEIDEVEGERRSFRPVRHHFGIRGFGVTAWSGREVGERIINEHDESDSDEELYVVLNGRAVFELDGDRMDAPAGTFVFVRPDVTRTAFAEEPDTTIVALGGTPGKAYEATGWELWSPLWPLYEQGEYVEVADRLREVLDTNPQYALLFYNLACSESMAGRTVDAVDHLRRAIEMSERFRALARDDSDFDPIRDDPAFKELTGS